MLPALMSLDFCCHIRVGGSELAANNIKPWIHHALYINLGPLASADRGLTTYLSIIADNFHLIMTTAYSSSGVLFQQDSTPCHHVSDVRSSKKNKTVWCCHVKLDANL